MNKQLFKENVKYAAAIVYRPFVGVRRKVVLYYHSMKADAVENFRQQMGYLSNRCHIVKSSEILSMPLQDRTVAAVTFDDAFESFYQHAVPVLKEYNISAGVFVPVGYIGQPCSWSMPQDHADRNEKVMTRDEIIELQDAGFEIFSHTMAHPNLTELSDTDLSRELADSKQTLEQMLKQEVTVISYPHGKHNRRVIDAAKESGYRMGFTVEPQCVDELTNPLAIGRFVVSPYEPLSRFKLKASGAYAVENIMRKIKRHLS